MPLWIRVYRADVPSNQVPLWVPIVVGFIGVLGALGAQGITVWRESRRWRRETEREQQKQRHAAREEAYAQVIGALEAYDWLLHPAKEAVLHTRPLEARHLDDARTAWDEARKVLGPFNLVAPSTIRSMLRDAMIPRAELSQLLLDDEPTADAVRDRWDAGQSGYHKIRTAMREDLRIDAPGADQAELRLARRWSHLD